MSVYWYLFVSRLQTAGIPSPEPIMLRSHVLVMGFVGKDDMYVNDHMLELYCFLFFFSILQFIVCFASQACTFTEERRSVGI